MSEILSPEEINALLSACNSAQNMGDYAENSSDKRQIRSYDFTRPNQFSREQLRALSAVHKQFAAGFSSTLTRLLNINIEADLISVDQITYGEYRNSLPENTLIYGISLEPLSSMAILELNHPVAEAFIDGFTGGTGAVSPQLPELSEIDRSILSSMVETILKNYEEAWAAHISVEPRLQAEGESAVPARLMLAPEQVVVISFAVKAGQANSMMSICLPAGDTAAALPENKVKSSVNAAPLQVPAGSALLKDSLSDVAIESKAILGSTSLAMIDIVNLQVGDIIKLDGNSNSPVELWFGDKPAYECVAGLAGNNVGLKITRTLPQESSHQL